MFAVIETRSKAKENVRAARTITTRSRNATSPSRSRRETITRSLPLKNSEEKTMEREITTRKS